MRVVNETMRKDLIMFEIKNLMKLSNTFDENNNQFFRLPKCEIKKTRHIVSDLYRELMEEYDFMYSHMYAVLK